jgi:ATP-binding cassette subfamily F protein 3
MFFIVTKKLPQPVKISNFFKEEAERKAAAIEARKQTTVAANTDAPSKRALKEEEAEKKRWAQLKEREARRQARAEQRKREAMQIYLSQTNRTRSIDINVDHFSMPTQDGGSELLSDASLRLAPGRRYGLIGRNGVGKTTLLRYISNYELPGFPTHLRVVHVEQEVRGEAVSVIDAVLASDIELIMLQEEEKRLLEDRGESKGGKGGLSKAEANHRLEQLHTRLEEIEASTARSRAAVILNGLGFSNERLETSTKDLSGGWRMRVALACALFVAPDLLLLDEPTNHLDFPAVIWLEEYLKSYAKTLLIVSHDRIFLNNVITDVMYMKDCKLEYYKGNYTVFEQVREEKLKQQQRENDATQLKREHMQKFVDKFRYNAKRAALVQSRLKAINRLGLLEEVVNDPTFAFEFPSPEPLQHDSCIECKDVTFGYSPSNILLQDVNVNVSLGSRIGVLGANGAGKTTLINLFTGGLVPISGSINRNGTARVATFMQHHVDQLKLHMSPLDLLLQLFPKSHPQLIRRHLGRFGVTGELSTQTIGTLSGGQKSRVALSVITWKKPHVLIMDEPTNHLDLETIEALIMAITGFEGLSTFRLVIIQYLCNVC